MITNKIIPAHILRLYSWALLEQEGAMVKVPYTDPDTGAVHQLIPVLPVEDEPKVSNSDKSYAIYGYAESDSRVLEQIREGVFSLRVIAPTYAELTRIINVISLGFESSDIATEAVNKYSSNFPNAALVGITFKQLKTTYIEGGEASESEGGPMDGVVNVSYKYINHLPTPIVNSARGGLWS